MRRKYCKIGTKVLFRGVIEHDDGSDCMPIRVKPLSGEMYKNTWFNPENLELDPNPAPSSEPVTVEMIEEAFEHLRNMVSQCQTPVLVNMLIEKGDRVNHKSATCDAVMKMPGAKGARWLAARGYLMAAGTCFSGGPETVSQGVKLAFEHTHRKAGVNPIADILGIAGCECKECKK